jgi:hypothetical protein
LAKRLAGRHATANGNRSLLQRKNQALGQAEGAQKNRRTQKGTPIEKILED